MISLRVAGAAALAGSLLAQAVPPALAQDDQERVPLIMSKLPPQGSALYNAIKRHAGKAKGQVLTLTKTEMWAVPKRNVEAVKKAAAQHGVGVDQLGGDWNHVFHSAPADMQMDDKQKSMMDLAKASRASMGVGMMMAPRAPTVEYALTKDKDANTPAAAHDAAKIIVRLSADKVLTITPRQRRRQTHHVRLARHRRRHRCAGHAHVVAGRKNGRHGPARGAHLFHPTHGRRDACRRRDGRGSHAAGTCADAGAHAQQRPQPPR